MVVCKVYLPSHIYGIEREKCGFSLEKIFDVDGLDGKIYSYLIKKDDYFRDK